MRAELLSAYSFQSCLLEPLAGLRLEAAAASRTLGSIAPNAAVALLICVSHFLDVRILARTSAVDAAALETEHVGAVPISLHDGHPTF